MFGDGFLVDIWNGSYTDPIVLSEEEKLVKAGLEKHINRLASEIGIRNTAEPKALEAAACYIENTFRNAGLDVRSQEFQASDGTKVRNIEAVIRGQDYSAGCLIVGAHYDSVDCPGANDNASAVAALLEIAAATTKRGKPSNTVLFVAFANEEPPYFGSDDMGSWVYARELLREKKEILGMVCLEDIGYYSTEPGSQTIPHPISAIYPNNVGNFVAICGNPESKDLVATVLKAFRSQCSFPSEGLAAPVELIPDITLSDNRSFWRAGIKAVMVTDTVYLRYPHYHKATDTSDKLTYPAFARVTSGLCDTVWTLINPD
jgi:Zn-dependent M28 family amino/carboxypeptidase